MKKLISIVSCFLVASMLFSIGPTYAWADGVKLPSETNAFVSNYYVQPINQSQPFMDVVVPEMEKNIKENNTHTVTPYYDKLPEANNPENFQGLGSTTYANINGKTVTAEGFYRLRNEGLHDPNCGMGLLIFQCLKYKQAHPEEDVKITFSSYRTSVTAAVCVIPESKYYGYMRSLYGVNYDEQGFVRISYMMVEAARMGIEVTLVNQLDSYGVTQYNPKKKALEKRYNLKHKTYFSNAMDGDCYDSYEPGKKVSDFLNSVTVSWKVQDITSDMQHVKSASVSHYLATDGTEHKDAVYFGSANLDENNYIGANGNNSSQSGVVVSDHSELYRVTYNYMQLMTRYSGQEEMFGFRKFVNETNDKQIALINAGREDEIPKDEQIVYLGGENDKVFELYYTPFGGGADAWDTVANPICKYATKLSKSEDYVEVIWNEFGYGTCHIGNTMSRMFEKAFCENPNPKNKISLRVDNFNSDEIQKLSLGSQIGYRSIKDGTNIHSKDILFSYVENGKRHNVSLLTSCNFYMIAFNYRTNSMLVINETEDSGGNFYNIFGEKYSYGMINNDLYVDPAAVSLEPGQSYQVTPKYSGKGKLTWTTDNPEVAVVSEGKISALKSGSAKVTVSDGTNESTVNVTVVECLGCYNYNKGLTCSTDDQLVTTKKLGTLPLTFQASFTVNPENLTGTTTLFGNDGSFDESFAFTLNKLGQPRVAIRDVKNYGTPIVYVFDKVNVATGKKVHLSISTNYGGKKLYCYVDGVLQQTIENIGRPKTFTEKHNTVVGGDHLNGNATYFPGYIHSVAAWSDFRPKAEVTKDYSDGVDYTDDKLLVAYDFSRCEECRTKDLSKNKNNLSKTVFWLDKSEVEPVTDFDYSFAVIGDTQTMCEKDPEAMESVYDWILENQRRQKIEYVIGLGDITDDSTDVEWENANNFIGKLNGKIPYTLTRGNHDDWDDYNRNLHNGFYENTIDGMMNEGTVSLTDLNQPGLLQKVAEDGTIYYETREGDQPEGGDVEGDLTNSYRYFSVKGIDYLIMTLDFAPTGEVLDWANEVIEKHPKHKVIVITHAYMYRDGTTLDAGDCYPPSYYAGYKDQQNGDDMWEKCFSKHKNVVMVLSGHDPWQHVVCRQDKGEKGNVVSQFLIDAQYVDLKIGSTAMVAMFYFSNNSNTLTVRYYSVAKECYGSPLSQFTIDLNSIEHNYVEVSRNEATTEEAGSVSYVCSLCKKTKTSTIRKIDSVKLSSDSFVYNGKEQNPSVVARNTAKYKLKQGTDYTVVYQEGRKQSGTYAVVVNFIGKYKGTKTFTFKINPIDISTCKVSLAKSVYTYNGKQKTPTVTVKNASGTKLKKDTHYTVTYPEGRKNAGTYKIEVKMLGNYSGSKTLTLKINPISVETCKVSLAKSVYTYDGKQKTPTVTVKNASGTKLKNGTHYTVTYPEGRKNAGTYKIKVKMLGNYSGTKTLTFKINPISAKKCKATLSTTQYTYNGKKRTPEVTVKNAAGTTLKKGTHYTVSYPKGRKAVGTYKVTVKFIGNYSGTKTLTFKIKSKKSK